MNPFREMLKNHLTFCNADFKETDATYVVDVEPLWAFRMEWFNDDVIFEYNKELKVLHFYIWKHDLKAATL